MRGTSEGRLRLVRGERAPVRGWYSRRLEHVEPAGHCTWSTETAGVLVVAALLWPLSEEPWPDPSLGVEVDPEHGSIGVRYVARGAVETVSLAFTRPS